MHLTQSAISQQIRSLEAFLEQPLFFRTGRSVTLTDAGHDLFSTAQVMLQQLAVGIRRLDQYRKPNQLIVNTTPAFARHWLMPRLGDFNRQHPQVDLWLFTSFEPPNMATDSIDLAIRDDLSAQADCTFNVLCSDRLYPACHPSLLALAAEQRVTLHGEREMDWSHWTVAGGAHVGQRDSGLNFSDPGLLLDAASPWAGHRVGQPTAGAASARRRAAATVNRATRARRQLGVAATPRQRTQPAHPALLPMAAVGVARRCITRHVTIRYGPA